MDKIKADILQIARNRSSRPEMFCKKGVLRKFRKIHRKTPVPDSEHLEEVELKMNLHTSRILFEKDSNHKYQFCTKVRAPSRKVSQVWAKYKDEVLDVSASN